MPPSKEGSSRRQPRLLASMLPSSSPTVWSIPSASRSFGISTIHRLCCIPSASVALPLPSSQLHQLTRYVLEQLDSSLAQVLSCQSAQFVFATFYDGTGQDADGWSVRASPAYVAVCGLLLTQYTITGMSSPGVLKQKKLALTPSVGFDASAHLSEETRQASWSAPIGVLTSVGMSALFGFFLVLCLLFSIQDFEGTIGSDYEQPVLQILLDIFGEDGAIVLFTLVIICVWHCGLFSLTSNSRMMFGFARDHGLPPFFAHVDDRFHSPIRTVWLGAFLSFCLALPSLGSTVAFTAATSIATSGLYISYGLPILIGLIWPQHFHKGPFNLGKLSRPVALVAVSWVVFIVIVFCLPAVNPVTNETLNYTSVCVGIVTAWALLSWILSVELCFPASPIPCFFELSNSRADWLFLDGLAAGLLGLSGRLRPNRLV